MLGAGDEEERDLLLIYGFRGGISSTWKKVVSRAIIRRIE